jgi:hypothetical protein
MRQNAEAAGTAPVLSSEKGSINLNALNTSSAASGYDFGIV